MTRVPLALALPLALAPPLALSPPLALAPTLALAPALALAPPLVRGRARDLLGRDRHGDAALGHGGLAPGGGG